MFNRMKGSILFFVFSLFFIGSCVHCSYPLREHIKARSQKRSVNFEASNVQTIEDSHSPIFIGYQRGLQNADKIMALPGQPKGITFDHYGGYVIVDPIAERALFYYFVESPNHSSSKPLVLWLNGGPGCSSIGGGAMMELGPFRVNSDGKNLWFNPYAWNSVANVLFLDSPAGVGFSYSNTSSDYKTGDKKTALDSYTFLVNWLERFPEYKSRDFYITGESYSGHFVPQLAQLILRFNKIKNQTVINLKGIAIGNPYIDEETNDKGTVDFRWSHDLISDELHNSIMSSCNISSFEPDSESCTNIRNQSFNAEGKIDPYNIYGPLCLNSSSSSENKKMGSEFDPCSEHYIVKYLNDPGVQKAFHANTTGIPGEWQDCNYFFVYHWQEQPRSVLPVIKDLSESGIRIWLYGGDTDSVCAVTTTRYAIVKMGLSVTIPWYPWINKVAGHVVGYKGLTFVTVRGAGHFVPSHQPARALAMFTLFLEGKMPPSS